MPGVICYHSIWRAGMARGGERIGDVSGAGCWKVILKTCHTVVVYVILKKKRERRAMK